MNKDNFSSEVSPAEEDKESVERSEERRKQAERAFLREKFLRMLTSIGDRPVELALTNEKKVRANFGAADVDFLHVQVNNLSTPIGLQPAAIVRTNDILYMTIDF